MALSRLPLFLALTALAAASLADRSEPHNYDLQDVTWHISFDAAARTIRGVVTNTIVVDSDHAGTLWFDCGPLEVRNVMVDGTSTLWQKEDQRLNFKVPDKVRKGQKIKVRITYDGAPSAGIYFVAAEHAYPAKSGMVYTQGEAEDNRYWLPTYDFPDDKATAECFIDVPPGQFALSNGKLIGIEKKETTWTYHWKISKPISTYLISFVAGDYVEGRESVGNLPVLWYVPRGTERWGQAAFAGTNRIVDFFNHLTGFTYPFEKFSQSAVADFMFGGMENASCVTQTIGALHKPENEPIANSEGLVAHELAHQWFGDTVTCADWSQAWLNEGFASFLPSFWFRQSRGNDAFDASRYDTFLGAIGSQIMTQRPVVSNKYEVPMDVFDGQIYGGGAARLFTLMGQIGEKTFWQGVKAYLNEYKFKNVHTEDFFAVMSRVSKRDLSTFRDQFFHSSVAPAFAVSRRGSDVVIKQSGTGFDLDLKVSFLGQDRVEKVMDVHTHGPETVLSAPGLESDLAVLDYPVTAMATIRYETAVSGDDLLRIWKLAPNAAAKLSVIGRFDDRISDQQLLDLAIAEKSSVVLRALIGKLKKNSVSFLVQLTHGFNRDVENAAVSALSSFVDDPQAADRLHDIWTKDANELIRNNALEALLEVAKDDALAQQAWSIDSQGEIFRVSALNWWARTDKKTAREKCLDVLAGPPDEPLKNTATRILGNVKDLPGQHVVFDVLMKLAGEQSYANRTAAINALVAYGDPAAIRAIEPLTKSSLFFTRRAAQAAVAALKRGAIRD